jgi:three-Cys-motif partner protein
VRTLDPLDDDGLPLPEVGEWGATKYALIKHYSELFGTAMKSKWDSRVFIDLFSGAGRARLEVSRRIVPTSAFLTLGVRHPFDSYVLCEQSPAWIDALEQRIARDPLAQRVAIVRGDCNTEVDSILANLPMPSRLNSVLCFCLCDPYRLRDLRFQTVAAIAERYVDFLVLIPSYMDAHRNFDSYLDERSSVVADFLGDPHWRTKWHQMIERRQPQEFGLFVVDQFELAMKRIRFRYEGLGDEVPIRDVGERRVLSASAASPTAGAGRLLYHLAFYSRHKLGMKFWR